MPASIAFIFYIECAFFYWQYTLPFSPHPHVYSLCIQRGQRTVLIQVIYFTEKVTALFVLGEMSKC